jgi:UDP-N-acetylmuramoyl-tripeptide--D-alanyl-D-alanine ligase
MLELRQAFDALSQGRLIAADPGDPSVLLTGVCTDTRAVKPGELFVAIRGERFDAHDFVAQARAAGAAALLVERWTHDCAAPALLVEDTRRALGEIAAGWRRRFDLSVIAVTGSNGKTTVKEMIASVLAAHLGEARRLATRGNLNNDIGVPLTLMRLDGGHRAAVIELGMNRPGEIAWLAGLAQATVALVNNAQREHQEFMHTVQATAIENGAALAALGETGVAVFPGDDPFSPLWRELAAGRRSIEFGWDERCAVHCDAEARPEKFAMSIDGVVLDLRIAIDGRHNVRNAMAAAACCHAAGVPPEAIARGLAEFRPVSGRLRRLQAASGAQIIDDSYNANPDSVRAAIDVLCDAPGERLLVLGDMGEVGAEGPAFHREIGGYARERGVTRLIAFGPQSAGVVDAFGAGAEHFDRIESICARAIELASAGGVVLVKGSRSMRMERVIDALCGTTGNGQAGHH